MSEKVKLRFKLQEKGWWQIWKPAQEGHEYIIGVDTASGEDDGVIRHDWHLGWVMDRAGLDFVAKFRAQCEVDVFAESIYLAAKWYNDAFVIVENNGGYGRAFLTHINKRLGYMNLYKETKLDRVTKQKTKKLGFTTTPDSKKDIVAEMASVIENGRMQMPDKETLSEMMTFVVKENGRPSAEPGCHDDAVMAACFCLHAHLVTAYRNQPRQYERESFLKAMRNRGEQVDEF